MSAIYIFQAILVAVLWGGNFVAAKIATSIMPPMSLSAFRFAITALLLSPWLFKTVPKGMHPRLMLLALSLAVLHMGLLFSAMAYGMPASTAAVIVQLGVPFSCFLGVFFYGDRIGPWRSAGIVLSLMGIFVIADSPDIVANPIALIFSICGAFFWATSNIILKGLKHIGVFAMLGWLSVYATPMLFTIALIFEHADWAILAPPPWPLIAALSYTIPGSTLLGYGLWHRLMQRFPVSQVAPFSLLVPVFGIMSGILYFGEHMTPQLWLGAGLALSGVAIIVLRRPKTVPEQPSS